MRGKIRRLGGTIVMAGALVLVLGSSVGAAEQVRLLMDWLYEGKHIPFFVARERGFFDKHGLAVTMLEGKGSGEAATFVDVGKVDYSYGDLLTAIQVMAKGGRNRAIGVGMVVNGGGFIFLESSGIKTPKDLEGKRFGTNPGDFGSALLPAVAAASGVDMAKIIIKTMEPAVRTPALLEGAIDFMSGANGSSYSGWQSWARGKGNRSAICSSRIWGLRAMATSSRPTRIGLHTIRSKSAGSSQRSLRRGRGR
jgi:NitT/TauT family transport system substrate-binding protein